MPAQCKPGHWKPDVSTPNAECTHFNALYKPVFCFAKQCNGSNKVSLFYLLVWGMYEARWKACIVLLCFCDLIKGWGNHLKVHIVVWCEGNLGWEVSPSLSLELLDLFKAQRQSDAYTCLRLVIRGSEVGSRDAIPLAGTASFISLSQSGSCHIIRCCEKVLHTLVFPNCSFSAHCHYVYSPMSHFFGWNNRYFCSRKKASDGSYLPVRSESFSEFSHCSHPPDVIVLLPYSRVCYVGFFPLYISSFSWWETCRQVGIEKLLDWGQLSCVWLLSAVVLQQTTAAEFLSRIQTL